MPIKVTISLIKADVGSLCGHHVVHPKQLELARKELEEAKRNGLIIDYYVFNCGDDLQLLMTHNKGEGNSEIHGLAWSVFKEVTEKVSRPLKLYAAGQDLLAETFSGNIKGMGPGVAEMEITERPSEPIVVFAADKTEPGAWNFPLYKIFASPDNTAGLVIDPTMHEGFTFRVMDVIEGKVVDLKCPEELYTLVALLGTPGRYIVERVFRKIDGAIAAVASTTKLSLIAGRYVGKDDPVLMIRAQHGFPAVGEILAPFAYPHLVAGWMRGSHHGPLMPVSLKNARSTFFDGPPRVVALGFQLANGELIGLNGSEPADLFDDPAFDVARSTAMQLADYIRRMGEFMPARLGPEELEYTTLPKILEKLKDRFRHV
ncbi:MAG: fructose-1,6-bisphosphate aldolase/phosphatase [Candidatus Nezhaarchaeota archaeon]|nr:fructose-1,6-bisphosphatase [Candidatus Nezhaarchaeota archaeon]MCX8141901.1 fructose-1,6-bisphosphate aldolase/phosphatase [Candidatus Nezhaarchaeota archaeon]MDW8050318.1 fructose-1,6-bisphosphate aldolase/phosphatase [Nitrososphaerota archaeon]